jgi:hypothetical protein
MTLAGIRDALLQNEAEFDREFTAKLDDQSRSGLKTTGLAFPAILAFMGGAIYLTGQAAAPQGMAVPALVILGVSGLCLALARKNTPHPRSIGVSAIAIAGACLFLISLLRSSSDPAADRYIAGQFGVVLLIALVALPLVDLNALLQDVVYLLDSEMRVRHRQVRLEFGQLEPVLCRPQQISAVLTNVLNLISDLDSRYGSTVRVQTQARERDVEIVFHGTGPQLRSNETQAIFEPGFAERSGRVVASNWVLFMARQVLRENGGEMRIEKSGATDHTLVISLPAKRQA